MGGQFESSTHGQFKSPQGGQYRRQLQFNGSNFNLSTVKQTILTSGKSDANEHYKYYYGDFNHDGIIDRAQLLFKDGASGVFNGFDNISVSVLPSGFADDVKIIDGDGDGKMEFLMHTNDGFGRIFSYNGTSFTPISLFLPLGKPENVFCGDFNGDGNTDFLCYKYGQWFVDYSLGIKNGVISYISKSISSIGIDNLEPALQGKEDPQSPNKIFETEELSDGAYHITETTKEWSFNNPAVGLTIDDINNDGKADIIFARLGSVTVYFSNGNSFLTGNTIVEYSQNPTYHLQVSLSVASVDMNADGKKEIIVGELYNPIFYKKIRTYPKGFIYPSINTTPHETLQNDKIENLSFNSSFQVNYFIETFNNPLENNLTVSKITDGKNIQSAFTITPTYTNQSATRSFPLVPVTDALPIATNLLKTDLNTNKVLSNVTYSFNDAYTHKLGKGFLGFHKTTAYDAISGIRVTKLFNNNTPIATPCGKNAYYTWQTDEYTSKNGVLVSSLQNLELQPANMNGFNVLFYPYISSSTYTDDLKGIATDNTIDKFDVNTGRVTKQTSISGDWTTETTFTYENPLSFISRIKAIDTKRTHNDDSYTSTISYGYDLPLRVNSITQAGLTTNFTDFDNYSNPTNTSVTSGNATRTTKCTYDTYGRYAISNTDVSNYTSFATYNPNNAAVLTQTDINGLVTSSSYSKGGSFVQTTTKLPDGSIASSKFDWDVTGTGLYYTENAMPNGNIVKTFFNASGQKLKETSLGYKSANREITYTYYDDGSIHTLTGLGKTTTNEYYPDGRLKTQIGTNLSLTYSYGTNTETILDNISNQSKTTTFDALGNITNIAGAIDNVSYEYFASGKVKKSGTPSGYTEMTYYAGTLYQHTLKDINSGTTTYNYNGFGQLTSQIDADSKEIITAYDPTTGRLLSKTGGGITTSYNYFSTAGKRGLLQKITRNEGNGDVSEEYDYDDFYRIKSIINKGKPSSLASATSNTYTTSLIYNSLGQVDNISYPTGLKLKYNYDQIGNVTQINDANGSKIWSGDEQNDLGQWTKISKGSTMYTNYEYDPSHFLQSIKSGINGSTTPTIQDLGFTFNSMGQLKIRKEGTLSEDFNYDNNDRLTSAQVKTNGVLGTLFNTSYGSSGNIGSTTFGSYSYKPDHPNAVSKIDFTGTSTGTATNSLLTSSQYNIENNVTFIENSENLIVKYHDDFTYGVSGNRFRVDFKKDGALQLSKVYIGNNEFGYDNTGALKYMRTIITAPSGVCALYQDSTDGKTMHYIHTDYLGSWLAITDASGNVEKSTSGVEYRYSYDAWGRPRNPSTWKLLDINVASAVVNLNAMQPRFDRGYTGHETMAGFGLINMNARLYDPYVQRFLSPDNLVQSPLNAQSFNRYSYCLNNPFKYNDPSGNSWEVVVGITFGVGILVYKAYCDGKAANNNKSNISDWDPPTSFMIGISSSPDGSNASCFLSVGWSDNAMPTVGYSSENGVGFGYSSYSGAHMAYAGYSNNDAITANTDRAIANTRAKYGEGWRNASSGIDWKGVTNASVGLIGGVAEMAIGGASEYFSAGTSTVISGPLIIDGGTRTLANGQRIYQYFNGNNSLANAYPTSLGGLIGKGIDMTMGTTVDKVGYGQAIGSWGNDLASFIATGGTGGALLDLINTPSASTGFNYFFTVGSYPYSMYYDKPDK